MKSKITIKHLKNAQETLHDLYQVFNGDVSLNTEDRIRIYRQASTLAPKVYQHPDTDIHTAGKLLFQLCQAYSGAISAKKESQALKQTKHYLKTVLKRPIKQ